VELKVRINKLDENDFYYPIKHLLEGMIVEKHHNEDYEGYCYFNQQQIDSLKREIPDDFEGKGNFFDPEYWIDFIPHDNLFSTNLNIDIKCVGCDNQITTSVCPHCGEWN